MCLSELLDLSGLGGFVSLFVFVTRAFSHTKIEAFAMFLLQMKWNLKIKMGMIFCVSNG